MMARVVGTLSRNNASINRKHFTSKGLPYITFRFFLPKHPQACRTYTGQEFIFLSHFEKTKNQNRFIPTDRLIAKHKVKLAVNLGF